MELRIVNPDPKYPKVELSEPTTLGYIYVAGAVSPGPFPFVPPNAKRARLLRTLKEVAHRLERTEGVKKVTVFRAIAIPPAARLSSYLRERGATVRPPRFDVLVLVETVSPELARDVKRSPAFEALMDAMGRNTETMRVIIARNGKRIRDVDETRQGLFLFNHFVAEDLRQGLELWDYLASWFKKETGLDNSRVLLPVDGEQSEYSFINEARWDKSLPKYLWEQLSKKSFRTFVLANLNANHVGAMPAFYRLA
jgi:hypothetical protein